MIGRISGKLLEKQLPWVVVDVQGVGYELQLPMSSVYQLGELGAQVVLHTHLAVSETSQQLFGFAEKRDRELFRILIRVSGVGPKMALAILSGLNADELVSCVMDDNVTALVKVPGVGKKTAERLLIELRDKLKSWKLASAPLADLERASSAKVDAASSDEAESALQSLGYKPAEAAKMVASVVKQHAADVRSSEDLIRLALKSVIR